MSAPKGRGARRAMGIFVAAAIAAVALPSTATAQPGNRESLPVDLTDGPSKPGFDIERFSNAGNGWFETFYVEETESLKSVLDQGRLASDTRVLVLDTDTGKLALINDQMAFHHLAQGTAGGKDWLATF